MARATLNDLRRGITEDIENAAMAVRNMRLVAPEKGSDWSPEMKARLIAISELEQELRKRILKRLR